MSTNVRPFLILAIVVVVILTWMGRYHMDPGVQIGGVYRLDRWTGSVEICSNFERSCRPIGGL